MPIRFRCAFCNQLMGIARRKAGTVVRCPTCGGQVIVPEPEPETAAQSASKKPKKKMGDVFENSDFDDVLKENSSGPTPLPPSKTSPGAPPSASSMGQMINFEDDEIPKGIYLTTGKMILLSVILLMLLALAFFAGLLVGRSYRAPKETETTYGPNFQRGLLAKNCQAPPCRFSGDCRVERNVSEL